MIFQNIKGESKLNITDSVLENDELIVTINSGKIIIRRKDNMEFKVAFFDEIIYLPKVYRIVYTQSNDFVSMTDEYGNDIISSKELRQLENAIIEYVKDTFVIRINKYPMYKFAKDTNENYPKFDLSISDCVFSMKIYLTDDIFLNIPYYQTHKNLENTLEYIIKLNNYLTEVNPEFIFYLSKNSAMRILLQIKDENSGELVFKRDTVDTLYGLEEQGIHFKNKEENALIDYHSIFGKLLTGEWEIEFIDPDEVDMGEEDEQDDVEVDNTEFIQETVTDYVEE